MTYFALSPDPDKAEEMLSFYLKHPVEFVEEMILCGREDEHGNPIHLDDKQKEALIALADGKWPVMQKARGTGGTMIVACGAIWWLYVHPTAKIIANAPKLEQLEHHLWPEIKRWLTGSLIESDFEWTKSKIFLRGREQLNYAIMQTAAEPERLQGAHDPFLLLIIEEASGVRDDAFNALLGSMTQENNSIVIVYNPTKTTGFAIEHFQHPYGRFHPIHMPAIDLKTDWKHHLVQEERIENLRRKGIDDPYFRIYALGLPPLHDADAVIPFEWVWEASQMELPTPEGYRKLWGLDPAFTGDRVGFCERIGPKVTRVEAWTAMVETRILVGKIVSMYRDLPERDRPHEIVVDSIGVGWGVADGLRDAGLPVTGVSVARNPANKDKFERLRSELWWEAREWFETRAVSIPPQKSSEEADEDQFIQELTTPKYTITGPGKIRVEQKEEFKKRLGRQRSPDLADAFILTFAIGMEKIAEHQVDAYLMDDEEGRSEEVSWVGAW